MSVQTQAIFDYTKLTCTNLFIKVKIQTKKLVMGESITFLAKKSGIGNLEAPFSKKPYSIDIMPFNNGSYKFQIKRN